MKKLFLLLLIGCVIQAQAQIKVNFGTASGNVGDIIDIPVTMDNFKKLESFQFSVLYDSLVLNYEGFNNRNPKISAPTIQDFDMWRNTRIKNGQLGISWNIDQGSGVTIPSNEAIFNLRFKLKGKPCDSSFIRFASAPTSAEFTDSSSVLVPFDMVGGIGKAKILGAGCNGGGGGGGGTTNPNIIASEEIGPQNSIIKIKISVKNFKDIASMQGTLKWDPTIANFDNIYSINLRGLNTGQFQVLPDNSGVRYSWAVDTTTGITLADNTVIFELGLKAIGPKGAMTAISFVNAPTGLEISNYAGDILTTTYQSGKLTISQGSSIETVKLYYRDTFATENSELCIPLLVDGFDCMESFQFAIKYDKSLLQFSRISNTVVTPFGTGNVNHVDDSIRILWNLQTVSSTIPKGTHIFYVCFNVIGKCTTNTKLSFVGFKTGGIEFTNCRGMLAFDKAEANIQIRCGVTPVSCVVNTEKEVSCFGVCDGAAAVTISGGVGPFTYEWLRTSPLPSIVASTVEDPTNLCAGEYRLRYRDVGNANTLAQCPLVVIGDQIPISFNGNISHVTMQNGSDGKVDINTIAGGVAPYTFMWFRSPNTTTKIATTEDLINRTAGTYIFMITDSKGCSKNDTFKILPFTAPLTCSITQTDSIKCFGECTAALSANILGGMIQYTYKWEGPSGTGTITTSTARNLCAGVYNFTVTDAANSVCTATKTITQPNQLLVSVISQTNGMGEIAVSGGTPAYTVAWKNSQGQIVASGAKVTLPAGTYTVCVTDKNNCTRMVEVIISPNNNADTLKVNLVVETKPGGGALSCKGACDGRIVATATGGRSPYTYKWSHNANLNNPIAADLCAGTYRVTITDNAGNTRVSSSAIINDPTGVSLSIRRLKCTSDNVTDDGSYEVIASGGSKPYTYAWCSGETTAAAVKLASGTCSVTVTDANGCSTTESFTVCIIPSNGPDCYAGRLAISPNNDGNNDVLEIACSKDVENVLNIYDRWGKLVYTAKNYLNTWNAVDADGKDLNEGTYMWVLLVKEPGKNDTYHKGTVTVVR